MPKADMIFERLRNILHEAQIEQRVQYMVEVIFANRKDGFKDFPAVKVNRVSADPSKSITKSETELSKLKAFKKQTLAC